MRAINLAVGEYYHIYNRGVDKRSIVVDQDDLARFYQSLKLFNTQTPIGSIFEHSFAGNQQDRRAEDNLPLVEIVCYAINPNHFHLLLKPLVERGIEKYLHRLTTGYSKYFNRKHKRSGALFQGSFKSIHVDSNEYLLHLSFYINLNDQIHQLGRSASKLMWQTSINEYESPQITTGLCSKDIVLGQFDSTREYLLMANNNLPELIENKVASKELADILFEEE